MKVINEKDYVFVGIVENMYKFITNPNKVNFDKEIILIERARLVQEDGKTRFFNYLAR